MSSSMFLNNPVDEAVHLRDKFGGSELDFLEIKISKPREVIREIELSQQVIAFFNKADQSTGFSIRRITQQGVLATKH